jgi:transposase
LTGIIFVLKSGIPWEMLPQELGCGSGMTCWRRLRDWQGAGLWKCLHRALLQRLQDAGHIDWTRASLDSASVPAPGGGEQTGKNPTNRGKLGTKHHIVVDRHGLPLAVTVSGSNVHDSKLLEATVDAIAPLRLPGKNRGRPRKRPVKLHADKGYNYSRNRQALRTCGIIPRIARHGIESSERLGRYR